MLQPECIKALCIFTDVVLTQAPTQTFSAAVLAAR